MSIEHYPKPEVGMEVFVVPSGNHRGKPYTVAISKIGRKWAALGNDLIRMGITTWRLDGGKYNSPGTCYPSEQYYNETIELSKAWDDFRMKITLIRHSPDLMTVEKINQALVLLGLEVK